MTLNILLGVLGIVFYTLIKARPYILSHEKRDWRKFFNENLPSWLWAVMVLILVSVILTVVPESSVLLTQALGGMDIENSPIGFLGLGMLLSFGSKEAQK